MGIYLERAKGFEPSTPTLARSCSTTELHPHPLGRAARRPPWMNLWQMAAAFATDAFGNGRHRARSWIVARMGALLGARYPGLPAAHPLSRVRQQFPLPIRGE